MPTRSRAALMATALIAAVALFIALRPDDASNGRGRALTVADDERSPTLPATTSTSPAVPRVRAVNLKPVGGVKDIKVREGDRVRFLVFSDRPESVHLHGYDLEKPAAPGRPASFRFKATITGIFEVELEGAGEQVIRLTVEQ